MTLPAASPLLGEVGADCSRSPRFEVRISQYVASEPPGEAGADQLVAQAPTVKENDLGDGPAVAVQASGPDRGDLPEGQLRGECACPRAEVLAALGGVDAVESDPWGKEPAKASNARPTAVLMRRHHRELWSLVEDGNSGHEGRWSRRSIRLPAPDQATASDQG